MIDKQKEEEFYAKDFNFSYSSINKLKFSPSLFYKDYILLDREVQTEKHLIEGKLIHCLLFEPENLKEKFNVVPGKSPSDNIRKVMKDMTLYTDEKDLDNIDDHIILDSLKHVDLYQSLKTDESRIAKIRVVDFKPYWEFLNNKVIDVVDTDTLEKCKRQVEILESNKDVMKLFRGDPKSDFELDTVTTYAEKYLQCDLQNYKFGLHGYIDYFKVNDETAQVIICDLKTTSKTISDFTETIEFYNYWLQAAIYYKLVYEYVKLNKTLKSYEYLFKFVVIDKYNQVYVFDVSESTMHRWGQGLRATLNDIDVHYTRKDYSLPVEFLKPNKFIL